MDDEIRSAAFRWLRESQTTYGEVLPRELLSLGFAYGGRRITLIAQQGIWRPKACELPLTITTSPKDPYSDGFTEDGLLEYRYRGTDPNHRDNVGLRELMRTRTPLIHFRGIVTGRYLPVWPVLIVDDSPATLTVTVAVEPEFAVSTSSDEQTRPDSEESRLGIRRYVARVVRQRVHQSAFRERVVAAYSGLCTLCQLRHRELLDAAHIIPDADKAGVPEVPNGLCLCKIHHAAFDQNIIGITPDYQVEVRKDVLEEIDGPMLKHGWITEPSW